jgi:hypothetical protein
MTALLDSSVMQWIEGSICLTKGNGDEGDTYPLRQRQLGAKLSASQLALSESQLQWSCHSSLALRHLHTVIGISLTLSPSFQLQCVGRDIGVGMVTCDWPGCPDGLGVA